MNARTLFGFILALSMVGVAVKLAVNAPQNYGKLSKQYANAVRAELERRGFYTFDAAGLRFGFGALRGSCKIWAAPSLADGDNDALFTRDYSTDADVFFVYNNRKYDSRPNFLFLKDRFKARAFSIIGQSAPVPPVFVVSLNAGCSEDDRATVSQLLSITVFNALEVTTHGHFVR